MTVAEPAGPGPDIDVRTWPAKVLSFAFDATLGIVRDFYLDVYREGVIRLKGLSPLVRAIVGVAMGLVVAAIVALVTADRWRHHGPLVARSVGQVGRGTLIPQLLLALTLYLLAVGSALILAGALRAARALRFLVLLVFCSFTLEVRNAGDTLGGGTHDWRHWAGWAGIVVVLVVFAAAWRFPARPGIELGVLLAATLAVFGSAQSQLVGFDRFAGTTVAADHFDLIVGDIRDVTLPLVFAAGLGVVAFSVRATGWVMEFVDRRVPTWGVLTMLAGLLAWRTHDLLPEAWDTVSAGPAGTVLGGYVGAAGLLAVVGAVWWVVERAAEGAAGPHAEADVLHDDELEVGRAAGRAALPLGAALTVIPIFLFALLLVLRGAGTFDLRFGAKLARFGLRVAEDLTKSGVIYTQRVVVCILGLALAVVLARRGRRVLALYIGVVTGTLLYAQITQGWSHFTTLDFTAAQADELWFAATLGLALVWSVRGTLTEARSERLFFVALIAALLRQRTFASDPLGPVLGFAGVGFVVFGLVWGFLTAGSWANESSPAFPRPSRVYLYLGYSLFGVTLLVYFTGSHQVATAQFLTSTQSGNGFDLLGMPLMWALTAIVLAGAVAGRPLELKPRDPVEDPVDEPGVEPAVEPSGGTVA